jgi:hypothetical protein
MANLLILLAGTIPPLGRDDLSALQAGRSNQGFHELSAFSPFDFYFPSHGGRSIREFIIINQFPRPLGFGMLRSTLIMPLEPFR